MFQKLMFCLVVFEREHYFLLISKKTYIHVEEAFTHGYEDGKRLAQKKCPRLFR
jgi:hypothetical protein